MSAPIFITGAAGFIGSILADRLLAAGESVVGFDNFATGYEENLVGMQTNPRFRFVRGDVLDAPALTAAMKGCGSVYHFAANADVRFGFQDTRRDLEQNVLGTFNTLEAMRANGIPDLVFASSGIIYGECPVVPSPEDAPMPVQTSLYGASKMAAEGLITAFAEGFALRAFIFRFVGILGARYSHGHILDFYRRLNADPTTLRILGDGTQRKSYLEVNDCLDAIALVLRNAPASERGFTQIYNLGTEEVCEVNDSVRWVCEALKLNPDLQYTGGPRGWIGDNPVTFLDTRKIRALGWKPRLSIREGVAATMRWLQENPWMLERAKARLA